MNRLLDTHAFLPWLDDPRIPSEPARAAIGNGKNAVLVSAAVVWQIAIEQALGKLDAPDDLKAAQSDNRFSPLAVTVEHALAVRSLPHHHRDPFDRILSAQALCEGLTLVSRDASVLRYALPCIIA